MTYNIRYDNSGDGENRWPVRRDFLTSQLKFYEPDIFGIQEGLFHQLNFIDSSLTEYDYVGVGRKDGKTLGEYSAIFYNTTKLKIIESSTFWLSETPEKTSVGWDAALERICTYALFENLKNNQRFWIFNTHFDHRGKLARDNSARLIINKINSINKNNQAFIFMGDLNLEPDSEAIRYISGILNDSKVSATEVIFGPDGTFNGFDFESPVTKRIDYIFTGKNSVEVKKYAVLSDSKNCRYPSDHLPVYVEIIIE